MRLLAILSLMAFAYGAVGGLLGAVVTELSGRSDLLMAGSLGCAMLLSVAGWAAVQPFAAPLGSDQESKPVLRRRTGA